MPRQRVHQSNAERQRAYRARRRAQSAPPGDVFTLTPGEAAEISAFLKELSTIQLFPNPRLGELIGRLSP